MIKFKCGLRTENQFVGTGEYIFFHKSVIFNEGVFGHKPILH